MAQNEIDARSLEILNYVHENKIWIIIYWETLLALFDSQEQLRFIQTNDIKFNVKKKMEGFFWSLQDLRRNLVHENLLKIKDSDEEDRTLLHFRELKWKIESLRYHIEQFFRQRGVLNYNNMCKKCRIGQNTARSEFHQNILSFLSQYKQNEYKYFCFFLLTHAYNNYAPKKPPEWNQIPNLRHEDGNISRLFDLFREGFHSLNGNPLD